MPALMDVSGERPSCMPKSKEDSFLPVIGSNRSSQSSSQGDSPHNNNNHYPPSEAPRVPGVPHSRCTSVAESLRLPSIDRSKTNSICSFTSNSTCASRTARRTNSFRLASQPELCRSPSCPNLAELDAIFTEDGTASPRYQTPEDFHEIKSTHSDHQLGNSIKLPTIGNNKDSNTPRRRSNINNNAERGRHKNNIDKYDPGGGMNGLTVPKIADDFQWSGESHVLNRNLSKRKSSSLRLLSAERENGLNGSVDHSQTGNRLRRSESMNSVNSQSSNQMPLLFPLRHNESRGASRRSRKSSQPSRVGRSATNVTLKENQLREVAEKLETLHSLEEVEPPTQSKGNARKNAPTHTATSRHKTKDTLKRSPDVVKQRAQGKEVLQSRVIKDNYENTRKKQANS